MGDSADSTGICVRNLREAPSFPTTSSPQTWWDRPFLSLDACWRDNPSKIWGTLTYRSVSPRDTNGIVVKPSCRQEPKCMSTILTWDDRFEMPHVSVPSAFTLREAIQLRHPSYMKIKMMAPPQESPVMSLLQWVHWSHVRSPSRLHFGSEVHVAAQLFDQPLCSSRLHAEIFLIHGHGDWSPIKS